MMSWAGDAVVSGSVGAVAIINGVCYKAAF